MNEARTKKQEKPSYNNTQPSNDVKLTKKNILDSVYERFADRSKSPDIGFKNVQSTPFHYYRIIVEGKRNSKEESLEKHKQKS